MARIWPRPSAVACTSPPPAEAVTVCCASWDWISESRNCTCCPSWNRLDKSAIRRKLPLAQTGGKLLQQLQVQRVDGGVEGRVLRPQRVEPVGTHARFRHPSWARSRPLPAGRTLQSDAHRLRDVSPYEQREGVPLALATSVACNSAPSMGLFARASSIIRGQRARTRSTVKGPFSGGGTAGEEGRGKGVTGAASRSTGAVSLFSLPSSPFPGFLPSARITSPSSTVRPIIAHRNNSSSTARRALPLVRSCGSSSDRSASRRTTSGGGSREAY